MGCVGTPCGVTPPPDNHRVKTVCENNVLRLQCRPKSVLAIYSAHYGRFLRGKPECDAPNAGGPHIGTGGTWFEPKLRPGIVQELCADGQRSTPRVSAECLAPDALRRVSKKCHRKGNCTVAADWATFGDPCLPGTKKQLRVSYTCGESSTRSWPWGWGRSPWGRAGW